MSSLAEQLVELFDPGVKSVDPEDDIYEDTRAKLVERDELDVEENQVEQHVGIGRRKMQSLEGMGDYYRGKIASRNQVLSDDEENTEDVNIQSPLENDESDVIDDPGQSDEDDRRAISLNDADDIMNDDDDGMDEEIDSDEADGEGSLKIFESGRKADPQSKSKATRNQFCLWESMLEARIKCQKILSVANRLPTHDRMDMFKKQVSTSFVSSDKMLANLLFKLVELETKLLAQNTHTQAIATSKNSANKRKSTTPIEEVDEMIEDRFSSVRGHRNKVLKLWYDKTRLTTSAGNSKAKSFSNFERSTVTQIEDILQDRERLIKRTQLKRSNYRVLGTFDSDKTEHHIEDSTSNHSSHLKEFAEEIYDDDDFYHQLLRQLIEQKASGPGGTTDPVELTRQWLRVQRLRSKAKKNVDTKASKGRKIRYEIHHKLQSFMAPNDHSDFTHDSRNQLFKSLFGNVPDTESIPEQ